MTPEIAELLRKPFPPEHVGKLPRVWCGACREATKANRRQSACDQHRMVRCDACHNRITDAHLHLDYVGHAETTDRLLAADPEWTWEPLALVDGLPAFDRNGGLWIRLTVAGTTRLGYGSAEGKTGPDAVKETIGDAIRNAAMRFGVAIDLWGAKFKADEPAEPQAETEDWEAASPASREQAEVMLGFQQRIGNARTAEDLTDIGSRVKAAARDAQITQWQFERLFKAASARLAAIKQAEEPPQAEPEGEAS